MCWNYNNFQLSDIFSTEINILTPYCSVMNMLNSVESSPMCANQETVAELINYFLAEIPASGLLTGKIEFLCLVGDGESKVFNYCNDNLCGW